MSPAHLPPRVAGVAAAVAIANFHGAVCWRSHCDPLVERIRIRFVAAVVAVGGGCRRETRGPAASVTPGFYWGRRRVPVVSRLAARYGDCCHIFNKQ